MKLILGSQSPRRKEILESFSIPFTQATSSFDEEAVPFKGDPQEYVTTLSQGKAKALLTKFPDAMILTADTVVFREGKVYNKPKDEAEARQNFKELSGQWHSVFTGVTLLSKDKVVTEVEEARVLFNDLSDEQIEQYLTKIHWADKAGGYAIQMSGGLIVKKIDGCYYNVKGLPINTVDKVLKEFGYGLWMHL
ncbi:MAG: septum formation protein Maf [Verrucomicrobia bacterium]|nr:septum formation protein Maf [Verrucomicrobiota bacterium]